MATPILNTIVADVNQIVPNLTSLVSSYRLLVGSAEEINRIPGVPLEIYERSITRFDRAGTLIDILLEVLCCKITFLAQFLSVTCAPIDIFSMAQNPLEELTVEQIIELEVLRLILKKYRDQTCCFCPPLPLDLSCNAPCSPPEQANQAPPQRAACPDSDAEEYFVINSQVLKDLLIEAGLIVPVRE